VVELYPVKVKAYIGILEEFRCSYSYNSSFRFKIEFLTFPEWPWLLADLTIRSFNENIPLYPPGLEFPSPKWDNVLTARIPIVPKLQRVICRITNEDGEPVAEVFSSVTPG
jgi:hypothetical protein